MRITRVTTRVGDRGTTRLAGGAEVPKDDVRIRAYGTVDELNAAVGVARAANQGAGTEAGSVARLDAMLRRVQNDLFEVGGDLATPASARPDGMRRVGPPEIARLERWIEELNAELPPLVEFVLPGGGPVGSVFHLARTTCRRAEREVVALARAQEDVGDGPIVYLNRLSDWLFVAGRWAARRYGEPEEVWRREG